MKGTVYYLTHPLGGAIIKSAALKLNHITKIFGKNTVLREITLQVEAGDIFGLLGNNGAGKTTTIRIIFGLIKPTAGRFSIFDQLCPANLAQAKRLMGGLVEVPSFYPNLTGQENLSFLASLSSFKPTKKEIEKLTDKVGLDSHLLHCPVGTYSHGQKQRLAIAQALLPLPRLLVLDEPTSGLDPEGLIAIRNLILELNRESGITFFISSHELDEVEKICNKVAIIDQGRLLKVATIDDFRSKPCFNFKVEPVNLFIHFLQEKKLSFSVNKDYIAVEIEEEDVPAFLQELTNLSLKVYQIFPEKAPSLEEVFLQTVKGPQADASPLGN